MKKVFISAGDPSGDLHAARLMKSIHELAPEIEFIGIGGAEMTKAGLKSIVDIEEISVVGFWEVIKRYGFFKKLLQKASEIIASDDVAAFVPVDYPGFNIRLAKAAKASQKKVIYYIAPQLWAWGKERAKKLKGNIDILLVVFPFEQKYFSDFGLRTEYIGHPLMDDPFFETIPGNREKIISFFPGSRKQEISKHLPLYSAVADVLEKELPEHKLYVSGARQLPEELYSPFLINDRRAFNSNSRNLMHISQAAVIKTGTTNLEAALAGMPFCMAYQASSFNYMIGKRLLNLDYVSLPNILANKAIVKEFIQNDATPNAIADEVLKICNNPEYTNNMISEFKNIRKILGEKGAARNAAQIIVNEI